MEYIVHILRLFLTFTGIGLQVRTLAVIVPNLSKFFNDPIYIIFATQAGTDLWSLLASIAWLVTFMVMGVGYGSAEGQNVLRVIWFGTCSFGYKGSMFTLLYLAVYRGMVVLFPMFYFKRKKLPAFRQMVVASFFGSYGVLVASCTPTLTPYIHGFGDDYWLNGTLGPAWGVYDYVSDISLLFACGAMYALLAVGLMCPQFGRSTEENSTTGVDGSLKKTEKRMLMISLCSFIVSASYMLSETLQSLDLGFPDDLAGLMFVTLFCANPVIQLILNTQFRERFLPKALLKGKVGHGTSTSNSGTGTGAGRSSQGPSKNKTKITTGGAVSLGERKE